ncbi:MAG TPA: CocE/NonD family hydrolase [Candidatus Aminicenantes bacterium]|nr:CocE/NonD family hydrolase [Candidatus Aminicenantes bacterium]
MAVSFIYHAAPGRSRAVEEDEMLKPPSVRITRNRNLVGASGRWLAPVILALAAAGLFAGLWSPPAGALGSGPAFEVREVMIPMRDGTRLHTMIHSPKDADSPLPIILNRTPYGVSGSARRLEGAYKELAGDGYIFAFQDIRGRYESEGSFVMIRPARDRSVPGSFDEASDAYDTVAWLVANVPGNNGRVGMLGVSYDGWLTAMALIEPHPALKAVSPQAPPADMWLGDDFFHNGAFRLSYGFEYATRMETTKEQTPFEFDRYDTFDWYLALGPLSNVNAKHLKGAIPTWNDFVAHPAYDEFWKAQTLVPHLTGVPVPVLNVAGWWDQEDFYGPLRIYEALEEHDDEDLNVLVAGPWNHGGWNRNEGTSLGAIEFGGPTSRYYREKIQAPWFAYYLKDAGEKPDFEAWTFETGANAWRKWDAWPPRAGASGRKLYFRADGRLSFDPPAETGARAVDSYVSDPDHPVPYRHRPVEATYFAAGSGWSTWLVQDQRFVDDRPDVLSWESEPLDEDITLAGKIEARLFASTTGGDSDWIVKLIDVYPEKMPGAWNLAGYQLMVANEVFRGRYRNGFERPEPIPPNEIVDYTIDLHSQNYRFKKGHRIMVQVQSTWFPLIDRNPQTFVPNIFEAAAGDFKTAVQRIFRSASHPSHLVLPVVGD